jgi:uncharacterized protein YecE (DUF72 family)
MRHEGSENDEFAALRRQLDLCLAQLSETVAERDQLRARLRESLQELEHWRTLAECREKMLTRQSEDAPGRGVPPWMYIDSTRPDDAGR